MKKNWVTSFFNLEPPNSIESILIFSVLQCGVWCSVMQCGTVLCSVVQSGVWCSVVQCCAVWCSKVQFRAVVLLSSHLVAAVWQCLIISGDSGDKKH